MRVQLEKRGVLGAGQVKKGGSLPRHIPILNIYVSTPPGGKILMLHLVRSSTLNLQRHWWNSNIRFIYFKLCTLFVDD